jgi:hypothetical protein
MAVKPRANVPTELEFLLPEKVCKPIIIGDVAYDLYPLTEGEFEKLSIEVSKLFDTVFFKGTVAPLDYLVQKDVMANFLAEALKPLSVEDIKAKLTAKQIMYIASVLWAMNFETNDFTEEVRENFKKVLGWVGLGALMAPPVPAQAAAPEQTKTETP